MNKCCCFLLNFILVPKRHMVRFKNFSFHSYKCHGTLSRYLQSDVTFLLSALWGCVRINFYGSGSCFYLFIFFHHDCLCLLLSILWTNNAETIETELKHMCPEEVKKVEIYDVNYLKWTLLSLVELWVEIFNKPETFLVFPFLLRST